MPPLYEPSHLSEVQAWVHDLRRCVTTRGTALELGITRRAAAALLADLPSAGNNGQGGNKYEVHYSRVVRDASAAAGGSCSTTVQLVKEIVAADQTDDPSKGTIYSLALYSNGAPTVQSAHEQTKALLRDMVLGHEQDEAGALDAELLTDDVQPDERIRELLTRSDYDNMRLRRIAATLPKGVEVDLTGGGGGGFGSKPVAKKKPAASSRRATTAASFFGGSAGAASSSSKPPPSSKPKPTQPANKLGFASASAAASAAPSKKKAVDGAGGKENSENEDMVEVEAAPIAKKKTKKEKPSSPPKKESAKKYGNADDFVGDEDEDEDFLESEAQRRARKDRDAAAAEERLAEQKKKQAPANRRKVIQDDEDDEDNGAMDVDKKEKEAVFGEMDYHFSNNNDKGEDDATAGGNKNKKKKKRKKLVEKTSMDDRGFLITEKVWVEEDIPTDEEDNDDDQTGPSPTKKLKSAFGSAPAAAKKKIKPAAKNTKGMKQAGLGAFFGAKKK